ncbi:MAG: IS1595 family transposase [Rhizobiaceae bacterium]|nr:IS1595 family transposase [Rhizobiaceae bacterium]
MVRRWKHDRPPSLEEFATTFPDDWTCAAYLAKKRWPDGFVCPHCGGRRGWKLRSKPWVWECGGEKATKDGELEPCRKQVSVISGTVMHGTHLPLRTWFLAAHLVATHSNGISALQLQGKLGIRSYKTAWLLLHKLRRAMVDPEREKLGGWDVTVQVDESEMPFRRKANLVERFQGVPDADKIMVAGAVECLEDGIMGRVRLNVISSRARDDLFLFLNRVIEDGSVVVTDGHTAYKGMPWLHQPKVLPKTVPAHIVLKHIHRLFSLMKRWALGVYHGLRKKHADIYLQEFVFRFNRRRSYRSSFDSLLRIGSKVGAATYWDITEREPVFRDLKDAVRGERDEAAREDAFKRARLANVPMQYAKLLLDPDYPPEPRRYRRKKPRRPVLAKERSAFVVAPFQAA